MCKQEKKCFDYKEEKKCCGCTQKPIVGEVIGDKIVLISDGNIIGEIPIVVSDNNNNFVDAFNNSIPSI